MGLDLLLKNVRVVRPGGDGAEDLDIGIEIVGGETVRSGLVRDKSNGAGL